VEWKDPPPRTSVGKYDAVCVELRANPGRWALISTNANKGSATNLASKFKARPGFEARTHGNDVYARWVGP
jgi:hypothetical protein